MNYGSYLHAISLWVSSELYRVFVLVLFSYFSVFGSMWYNKLAVISAAIDFQEPSLKFRVKD